MSVDCFLMRYIGRKQTGKDSKKRSKNKKNKINYTFFGRQKPTIEFFLNLPKCFMCGKILLLPPAIIYSRRAKDGRTEEGKLFPISEKKEEKTNKRSANSGAKKKTVGVVFLIPMRIEARDLYWIPVKIKKTFLPCPFPPPEKKGLPGRIVGFSAKEGFAAQFPTLFKIQNVWKNGLMFFPLFCRIWGKIACICLQFFFWPFSIFCTARPSLSRKKTLLGEMARGKGGEGRRDDRERSLGQEISFSSLPPSLPSLLSFFCLNIPSFSLLPSNNHLCCPFCGLLPPLLLPSSPTQALKPCEEWSGFPPHLLHLVRDSPNIWIKK